MPELVLSRSIVSEIDQEKKSLILKEYGMPELLTKGSEAEIFSLSNGCLLKIYADAKRLVDFKILQDFYTELKCIDFATPELLEVRVIHDHIVVIEKRIKGRSMLERMNESVDFDRLARSYFGAVSRIKDIPIEWRSSNYLLFDKNSYSFRQQSYKKFLISLLQDKYRTLTKKVELSKKFETRYHYLLKAVEEVIEPELSLVHGDVWPGNLLLSDDLKVTGIIDFGLFTMWGDPLFDLAASWSEHTMYTSDNNSVRARLGKILLDMFGKDTLKKISIYALIHALITADLWCPRQCELSSDIHFKWAKELFCDDLYISF